MDRGALPGLSEEGGYLPDCGVHLLIIALKITERREFWACYTASEHLHRHQLAHGQISAQHAPASKSQDKQSERVRRNLGAKPKLPLKSNIVSSLEIIASVADFPAAHARGFKAERLDGSHPADGLGEDGLPRADELIVAVGKTIHAEELLARGNYD